MSAGREVYILGSLRTPRGKGHAGGALAGITPLSLVEQLLNGLVDRVGLDPAEVDDIILGSATQTGAQGANLARTAALTAGWDHSVAGQTVNRFCASGIDAIKNAAGLIGSGQADLIVAGGVESVSQAPMFADRGPLWADPEVISAIGSVHMGIAADIGATELGLSRKELDAYGVRTQELAARAWDRGFFDSTLMPVRDADGRVVLDRDELMRPVTVEQLATLEPAFATLGADGQDALALEHLPELDKIEHPHTRGTSPSLADGAALVVVGTLAAAVRAGLTPLARIVAGASVGSDPVRMLGAGQAAIGCALTRADLTPDHMDVVEFAEAFSAFCLKIQRECGFGDDRFNVNGGTIAMGHAFGATGAILTIQAVEQLRVGGGRYATAAVSGAAGLGTALILEAAR
ncbi:acetyl-CoA C-acetyltransferase [Dietzia kunjamensis subsp. schimae]|uniref:Acetyl-CoA C-acetyltransferase n=1 Tax=Dietzia kunjamensis subsp. schimae TaxID=498198 RepID=A0ABY1MX14_9ACTN|nr:acetyl-CoA C-acyltransferase [Dietzia kunjamensis]SMO41955.1 acetyl-CoA C-acetyltransferase [Dietzia kunjamensis subsp. schimae]